MFLLKFRPNVLSSILSQRIRTFSSKAPIKGLTSTVNPYSAIQINTSFHLQIKPYDLLDCPASNLVLTSLVPLGQTPQNSSDLTSDSYQLSIEVNENDVDIKADTNDGKNASDIMCILEVPVKASLRASANESVDIQSTYGDALALKSLEGCITCNGNTLARNIDLKVYGDQNMSLKKMQGDLLHAGCESGTISTDSCYVEHSKFIANKGNLHLKNVHKHAEINLPAGGQVDVTGFHGILEAETNGGNISYQLTEVYGNSIIVANKPDTFTVNISEFVEEHTCIDITAADLILDTTLAHFSDKITAPGQLQSGSDVIEDNLTIKTTSTLKLGKQSWMDTI